MRWHASPHAPRGLRSPRGRGLVMGVTDGARRFNLTRSSASAEAVDEHLQGSMARRVRERLVGALERIAGFDERRRIDASAFERCDGLLHVSAPRADEADL